MHTRHLILSIGICSTLVQEHSLATPAHERKAATLKEFTRSRHNQANQLCSNIFIKPVWFKNSCYFILKENSNYVVKKITPSENSYTSYISAKQLKALASKHRLRSHKPSKLHVYTSNRGRKDLTFHLGSNILTFDTKTETFKKFLPLNRKSSEPQKRDVSSNGKWRISFRNHNAFLHNIEKQTLEAITTDGTPTNSYSFPIAWSPNSEMVVIHKTQAGQRRKVTFTEKKSTEDKNPKIHSFRYDKPGDKIDISRPVLFAINGTELHAEKLFHADDQNAKLPFKNRRVRWKHDSSAFTYEYIKRGFDKYLLLEVSAQKQEERILINESSDTFIYVYGNSYCHHTVNDQEIIWRSERDGFNHLYLYDKNTGKLKTQITKGSWTVREILDIDEKKRRIIFSANGVYPSQDPYFKHLCSVNFDGTNFRILTEGDGNHEIILSEDKSYFFCSFSKSNVPPTHQIRDISGKLLKTVEKGNADKLIEAKLAPPVPFHAKDRDGKHTVSGWILKPYDFDPKKKYPVIEYIYAGPHGHFVPKSFKPWHGHISEFAAQGYFIVRIDGKGTNYRGVDFSHFCHKNLADSGFPDRIKWIKEAAAIYPQMDLEKVGIYGGSAGGQSSTGALINFNHFYKVAVSDCGCHDNRMDKIWWNEQWMGYPVGPHYAKQSNIEQAHKLKGKLMLTVGEIDKNVDPASTYDLSKALKKANIDHKLIVIPSKGHSAGETRNARHQRYLFFHKHLR